MVIVCLHYIIVCLSHFACLLQSRQMRNWCLYLVICWSDGGDYACKSDEEDLRHAGDSRPYSASQIVYSESVGLSIYSTFTVT